MRLEGRVRAELSLPPVHRLTPKKRLCTRSRRYGLRGAPHAIAHVLNLDSACTPGAVESVGTWSWAACTQGEREAQCRSAEGPEDPLQRSAIPRLRRVMPMSATKRQHQFPIVRTCSYRGVLPLSYS